MQLKAFRVQKFRNIEDSGEVELLDALTCVVGKNQAGKSALLRALHKFNPHLPAPYDMRREWPVVSATGRLRGAFHTLARRVGKTWRNRRSGVERRECSRREGLRGLTIGRPDGAPYSKL